MRHHEMIDLGSMKSIVLAGAAVSLGWLLLGVVIGRLIWGG